MNCPKSSSLFDVMAALQTEKEVAAFLVNIQSQKELKDMLRRWQIMLLLHQGLTYKEVQRRLKTTNQTISRAVQSFGSDSYCRVIIEQFNLEPLCE